MFFAKNEFNGHRVNQIKQIKSALTINNMFHFKNHFVLYMHLLSLLSEKNQLLCKTEQLNNFVILWCVKIKLIYYYVLFEAARSILTN